MPGEWYRVRSIRGEGDCSPTVEGFARRNGAVTELVLGRVLVRLRPGLARRLFELGGRCESGWSPDVVAWGGITDCEAASGR